jgi:predicted dehydrogenase
VIAEPVEMLYRNFVTAIREGGRAEPDFRRGADLQKIIDLCFSAEAAARARVAP